ncbi:MAG: C1 family peptidase [Bacteroidota bacterium]
MKKYTPGWCILLALFVTLPTALKAQSTDFVEVKILPNTPVKNQCISSTCWCFATVSFLESEILRIKHDTFDLSEMYVVRYTYPRKAEMHLRMAGYNFFTPGGQAHDVMKTISENGLVPQDVYTGMKAGCTEYNHSEIDSAIFRHVRSLIHREGDSWPSYWKIKCDSILDVYLGKPVSTFQYEGKKMTSLQFMDEVTGIKPEDYLEITSYTHHSFYESFCLESKFNWSQNLYYNLPLNDFLSVIDTALAKGYTVIWDGDVSEKSFLYEKGKADMGWMEGRHTQAMRQQLFDNHATTVDHLMHIVGTAKDAKGGRWYIAKNSWGGIGKYKGYMYLSASYVALKTVAVMVHKNALPNKIRQHRFR